MMINLTNIIQLDRSIYEHIRLELVRRGHLPDILQFTDPIDYKNAKALIKSDGILIDLYGVGMSESRDRRHAHTIVIDRKAVTIGVQRGGTEYFVPVKDTDDELVDYQKRRYPSSSSNVNYDIRHITNSILVERKIMDIMYSALGLGDNVEMFDADHNLTGKYNTLLYKGDIDASSTDFNERLYKYQFNEVWLQSTDKLIRANVPILTNITIGIGEITSQKILSTQTIGNKYVIYQNNKNGIKGIKFIMIKFGVGVRDAKHLYDSISVAPLLFPAVFATNSEAENYLINVVVNLDTSVYSVVQKI